MTAAGPRWTGEVRLIEEHLLDPLRWKRPRRVFVNSMSDLFHDRVTYEQLDRIFAVMALAQQHTFQLLTKRPERMRAYLADCGFRAEMVGIEAEKISGLDRHVEMKPRWAFPLPNCWLGVSVEDQAAADERIPLLLRTPALVRWVSAEPLLGPIDLQNISASMPGGVEQWDALDRREAKDAAEQGACSAVLDWVVVGGESGPGGRPMHPTWARSLRDQCKAEHVPFFFKQWGEWAPAGQLDGVINGLLGMSETTPALRRDGETFWRVGKKAAGDLLDGVRHHEFPDGGRE